MANNMGEIIRKLRKERDLTQEELAEQLGVTSQAVSKWENNTGMPDISQVVPLASFFGVSTDTLFDFCSEDKIREINEYEKNVKLLFNKGMMCEAVELSREMLSKYPGDFKCMNTLAHALFNSYPITEENAKEGIRLCERILAGCTDSDIRSCAIQLLTYWYSLPFLSIANEEKAVSYAKMGSPLFCSSDILLEHAYFTEEGKKEQDRIRDRNKLSLLDHICLSIIFGDEGSPEENIKNCQAALTLWHTLIPDENYLFYHCRISNLHLQIAKCYTRLKQKTEAFDALHLAVFHSKKADSIPNGIQNYTSSFVSNATFDPASASKNYSETQFELFLEELNDPCFDFIRDDPEFIALFE